MLFCSVQSVLGVLEEALHFSVEYLPLSEIHNSLLLKKDMKGGLRWLFAE